MMNPELMQNHSADAFELILPYHSISGQPVGELYITICAGASMMTHLVSGALLYAETVWPYPSFLSMAIVHALTFQPGTPIIAVQLSPVSIGEAAHRLVVDACTQTVRIDDQVWPFWEFIAQFHPHFIRGPWPRPYPLLSEQWGTPISPAEEGAEQVGPLPSAIDMVEAAEAFFRLQQSEPEIPSDEHP
jgi:hypothetical protein